jgi:DNA-binding beta-propeller fold protein YncE
MEPLEDRRLLAITLEHVGTYSTGIFDESAAEIVAHDPDSQRLFVTNANDSTVDVLDIRDASNPTLLFQIDTTSFGREPTSVDVNDGTLAVAVRNEKGGPAGSVAFFDTEGNLINDVQVGFGPDMLLFTPDGTKVLVANQGRPTDDYEIDPEGSVSIIDVSAGAASATVTTASFTRFNGLEDELRDKGVRIFGPVVEDGEVVGQAPAADDLEPEYIAVSGDSSTAWVTLQENNAIAILDISTAHFLDIKGLGYKNHRAHGNGLDASDRDGGINIERWRVRGMYQPDGIVAYNTGDGIRLITANEGGLRDEDGFNEEERFKEDRKSTRLNSSH